MTFVGGTRAHFDARRSSEWIFVDIGFSSEARSCGLATMTGEDLDGDAKVSAIAVEYGELIRLVAAELAEGTRPVNVVIEAPLSVAFGPGGNPCGRDVERQEAAASFGTKTRYWYTGLRCCVLVAAQFFLSAIRREAQAREVRLFEGFVSFKPKGPSNHIADVLRLIRVVRSGGANGGSLVEPSARKGTVRSIGQLLGLDFVAPLIVKVGPEDSAAR